jgi:hypothetical protein
MLFSVPEVKTAALNFSYVGKEAREGEGNIRCHLRVYGNCDK